MEFQNFGKLDKAIANADVDNNGAIDRKEFAVLMGTGFIALEELNRCLDLEAESDGGGSPVKTVNPSAIVLQSSTAGEYYSRSL